MLNMRLLNQTYAGRYLCEIAGTSPGNLLMEEAALLAMVRSQEEITALLRFLLTTSSP